MQSRANTHTHSHANTIAHPCGCIFRTTTRRSGPSVPVSGSVQIPTSPSDVRVYTTECEHTTWGLGAPRFPGSVVRHLCERATHYMALQCARSSSGHACHLLLCGERVCVCVLLLWLSAPKSLITHNSDRTNALTPATHAMRYVCVCTGVKTDKTRIVPGRRRGDPINHPVYALTCSILFVLYIIFHKYFTHGICARTSHDPPTPTPFCASCVSHKCQLCALEPTHAWSGGHHHQQIGYFDRLPYQIIAHSRKPCVMSGVGVVCGDKRVKQFMGC